jgi:RHS repeat-associated protein
MIRRSLSNATRSLPWLLSMVLISGFIASDVVLAQPTLAGATTSSVGVVRHGDVKSRLSGTPVYSPGELYGTSNESAECFTCIAANVTGTAPMSQSLDAGVGVDDLTGDFSASNDLFDSPGVGANLSDSLTYDAQLAQSEIASGPTIEPFGYGWSSTFNISETQGGGYANVNYGNDAQVSFTPASGLGLCPTGDYYIASKYTFAGSYYQYCALENVHAQFMFDQPTGDSYFLDDSSNTLDEFAWTGQLTSQGSQASYGTSYGYIDALYNVTPGTTPSTGVSNMQGCPSSATSCTIFYSTLGRDIVESLNSATRVSQVMDPSGVTYSMNYDTTNLNLTSVVDYANQSTPSTWNYVYDTGQTNSQYRSDLVQIYDPDSGATSSTPASPGATHSNYVAYSNAGTSAGMVTSIEDGTGATTTYAYADNCSVEVCLGAGDPQTTTVTYPLRIPCPGCTAESPVLTESYSEGVLLSSTLGTSSFNETWSYAWTMGWGVSGSTSTEVITYPNSLSPGTSNTVTVTLDTAGNIVSTTNAIGDIATSAYNDSGGNVVPELLWSYPGYSTNGPTSPPSGSYVYTYNTYGQPVTETDPAGNVTNYGYYSSGSLLCYVAPPSVTITGTPPSCGGAPTTGPGSYAATGSTTYTYDTQGDTTNTTVDYNDTATGADPQTTTAQFNLMGDQTWSIPPAGQGGTQSSSNPYAVVSTYTPANLPLAVTNPGTGTTTTYYDAALNPLLITTPAVDTSNVFDGDNRVCFTWTVNWEPWPTSCNPGNNGGTKAYTYVPGSSLVASVTDSNNNPTDYYYGDSAYPGSPTEVVDALGSADQYTGYDDFGTTCESGDFAIARNASQCIAVTGDTTSVFNALGNETSITDPSGNTTVNAYANTQYPTAETSTTNAQSATTSDQYDADGRMVKTTNPDGSIITESYDSDSRLCVRADNGTTYTCGGGSGVAGVTGYTYNGAGDRLSTTSYSPSAATTTYSYATGQLTSTTDSNAKTTAYLYNYGGQVQCETYPVSSSATCGTLASPATPSSTNTIVDRTYDSAGRLASVTDWLGHTTTYASSNGWTPQSPSKITYPSSTGVKANYGYDNASNLNSLTAGTSSSTTINDAWGYDADERVAAPTMQSVGGGSTHYNANNQITQATNFPSATTNDVYSVAANGEITKDAAPSGSNTSYGYNAGDELCWSANITSSASCTSPPTTASTLNTYSYSANGQRSSDVTSTGSGGGTISAVGSLQQTVGVGTSTLSVSPVHIGDALVLGVAINSSATVTSVTGGGATWQHLGIDTGSTFGNTDLWLGTVTATGSSTITVNFSTSISSVYIGLSAQEYLSSTGASTVWSKDTSGGLNGTTSSTTVAFPSLNASASGELYVGVSFDGSTGTAGTNSGFTYDKPSWGFYIFNTSVSGVVSPTATQSPTNYYGSDAAVITAAGSTTSTTKDYAWNPYGELCNVSATTSTACGSTPSAGTAYTYNSDGLRVTEATSTSSTDSTWDQSGSIPLNINDATTTGSTATNVSYIYGDLLFGGTAPIEQITTTSSGATVVYLVANQTGVQGVYSSAGSPIELALYSTYGVQTISSGSKVTPFSYQGSYSDPTGLIYLINRYYDPTTNQFISIDPDVATTNQPYVYTGDNPLNATDPLGLGAYKPKRWSEDEATAEERKSEGKSYNDDDYQSAQRKARTNQKNGWSPDGTERGPVRGHSGQGQVRPTPGQGYNFTGIPVQFIQGIETVAATAAASGIAWWLVVVIIAASPVGA